jgi:DMSO/TMAO reductase YedYZ molybdopterin-dependent catalytic subunit
MTPANKLSRRGFLVAITGSAVAAAAGCRPTGSAIPPTVYAPGGGPAPTNTARAVAQNGVKDATYGTVTYNKTILTETDKLYITQYNYSRNPEIKVEEWSLTVDGLVEKPVVLDYKTVQALPAFEDVRVLQCIGNPLGGGQIGNINWKGFDFAEVLKQVKVKANATHAKFEAADGYSTSVELKWITQPGVMMAYEMNGEPLSFKHGFPLRILMPGLYGQKMPRWITRIEFIDYDFTGYWEGGGWSNVASAQTNAIVKTPFDGYEFKAGTSVAIQGVAWAGTRKITKVEVQIEDGEWMPTELKQGDSPLEWTQWYVTWTPPAPGAYRVGVRATDEDGFVQTADENSSFGNAYPNGTTAIHRITVQAT